MSKMGQELERKLDENKYELYEICRYVDDMFSKGDMEGLMRAINNGLPKLKKVLARINGTATTDKTKDSR